MSRHIHARSEQPSFPNALTKVISDALREAAIAPTLSDALDVAGAALTDIANMARGEPPAAREPLGNDSLTLVCEVADETLRAFDRVASLLEAIQRLACDNDDAIADLAAMGRGLVAKQTDRVDLVFTCMARHASASEVRHG